MSRDPAETTHRHSRRKWRLQRSKGEETLAQLADRFDVHANQISQWRAQLPERAADIFGGAAPKTSEGPNLKELHAKTEQRHITDNPGHGFGLLYDSLRADRQP